MLAIVTLCCAFVFAPTSEDLELTCEADKSLFFSEAAEGSGRNQYLEIYNPTDTEIDLSGYAFPNTANAPKQAGKHEYWNEFGKDCKTDNCRNKKISSKGIYVLCNPNADAKITAKCDQEHKYLSNGNDGYCLVKGTDATHDMIDCA